MKRLFFILVASLLAPGAFAQIAVEGELIHTMTGASITNGIVLVNRGKIEAVGTKESVTTPQGYRRLKAKVVTPGFIDARTVVGMSGLLNQAHDQEQLERSAPIQPELRAIDGYNPRDPLVDWVRGFGVTTLHTGHGPGALVSGQTMIVKTHPPDLEQAVMDPAAAIAVSLGASATGASKDKAPGTSSKAVAMLRAELIKAAEYARKQEHSDAEKRPARDLRLETLARALTGKQRLLITVQRHQDIMAALRLADEFKLQIILDGVADAPLVIETLKARNFPVIVHPPMMRPSEQLENLSFETPGKLKESGVLFAFQSGFESYVPKTRVVLFEAAIAAANGLSAADALAALTIDAAKILGIDGRVGSLAVGKDADLALFDGDPFEYTTHCIGVIVSGQLTDEEPR